MSIERRSPAARPSGHRARAAALAALAVYLQQADLLAGPAASPRAPRRSTRRPGFVTTVLGDPADAQKRRESAEAVTVLRTDLLRQQSADLGEVLNRVQGVRIARTGGLGSDARFSLNGFTNDQVRFFLNGLPLEIAGFAFNLASIPVNLVDQVEIYRGVVPIRFGADALGGAVNLVSPASYHRTGASAALQAGSFWTYRGSISAHYRSEALGLFLAATGFLDATRNDYLVDVQVPDERGRLYDVTVPRFHDTYAARGVIIDAGVVDRPWARRLVLRAFYSQYEKDLQHNPPMTVPFGAARYDESLAGVSLHAAQPGAFGRNVDVEVVASYSRRTTNFLDTSADAYDWFGKVVFTRLDPGELSGSPHDITIWRDSVFGRLGLDWRIAPGHVLTGARPLSSAPDLPGQASVVRHVPVDAQVVALAEGAGFEGIHLTKFDAKPCFVREGVPMRQTMLQGWKRAARSGPSFAVFYKGPFREVRDDVGHVFPRGRWVTADAAAAERLRAPEWAGQFLVLSEEEGAQAVPDCGAPVSGGTR